MNELLLTQIAVVAVMVGTPGPNNLLLMTNGLHYGLRATLPVVGGILLGCSSLLLAIKSGLGQLLQNYPIIDRALVALCTMFLLYLVFALLRPAKGRAAVKPAPVSLWQAASLQWINPKSWMMCLTLISTNGQAAGLVLTFCLTAAPLLVGWAASGQLLSGWLAVKNRLLWFNRAMAVALLACAVSLAMAEVI